MSESVFWLTLASVRRELIRCGLTLPPRRLLVIADAQAKVDLAKFGPRAADDAVLAASAIVRILLDRRDEFADPAVVLRDILEWHVDEFALRLQRMPYDDFLRTWYWLALSSYVVVTAGRCQICRLALSEIVDPGQSMQAHHTHYRTRGFEVRDPSCLVALCDRCHQRFHGKEPRQGIDTLAQLSPFVLADVTGELHWLT